jgi:hypothetical protein
MEEQLCCHVKWNSWGKQMMTELTNKGNGKTTEEKGKLNNT